MEFLYSDLGLLRGGEEFEVTVSRNANVCLLDSLNFSRYQNELSFDYRGGYITNSVCRVTVPSPGRWYITIDLGGESGNIRYNIREIVRLVKEGCCHILPDRTMVYYDEFSDKSVRLTSVIRDGMVRSTVCRTFDSINDLVRYCVQVNWSKQ